MNKRIGYIDSVKGVAILLVIMGHITANFFFDWKVALQYMPTAMYWWRFIYSFHMPLLFFVSGFLFLSGSMNSDSLLRVWLHKSKPLVLPFLLMGVVKYLISNEADSYWYLRNLFFYVTIWMLYEGFKGKFKLGLLSDTLFVMGLWMTSEILIPGRLENNPMLNPIFDFPHFRSYWLYFSMGVLMRNYELLDKLLEITGILSVVIPSITIGYIVTFTTNMEMIFVFNFVSVMSLILCIFRICKERLNEGRIAGWLKYIGRHTLEIYVLHMFFIVKMPMIGSWINTYCLMGGKYVAEGLALELMCALFFSAVNIVMCAIIYEPLKAFPLLYECFFGRKIKLQNEK